MATMDTSVHAAPIANPAPLGLCAFALTTFILSCENSGFIHNAGGVVIALGLFYGGIAQVLSGMWEFKSGNTFGATAFTSYGAFWLSVAAMVAFKLIPGPAVFGTFLLGWTIFTAIMFLAAFQINTAMVALFGFLLFTFALLTCSQLFGVKSLAQIGGYMGIATALIAWYIALAGLLTSVRSPISLPIGRID